MNKGIQADDKYDEATDGFIETPWGTREINLSVSISPKSNCFVIGRSRQKFWKYDQCTELKLSEFQTPAQNRCSYKSTRVEGNIQEEATPYLRLRCMG